MTEVARARQVRAAARAVGGTAAVNALAMLIGVGTGVISAQALAPGERGIFVAVVLWTNTIAAFSLLGVDHAIIYKGRGDWETAESASRVVRTTAWRQVGAFSLLAVAVNAYLLNANEFRELALVILASAVVPLNGYSQLRLAPLLAAHRISKWNRLRVTSPVAYLVLSITLILTGAFEVETGLLAFAAGSALTALLCLVTSKGATTSGDIVGGDGAEMRAYGRRIVFITVPSLLGQRVDQLVMGLVLAPAQLGIYAVAVSVASVAEVMRSTIEQIAFPKFAANAQLRVRVRTLAISCMGTVAALGLMLLPFAGPVIGFAYGEVYVSAIDPLVWLGLAAAVQIGIAVLNAEAKAANRLNIMAKAQVGAFVTTSGALIFLLPSFGMTGAAASVLLGQSLALGVMWIGAARSKDMVNDSH